MTEWILAAGVLLPFLGTALGSGTVFLFPGRFSPPLKNAFFGFAAGVMTAASVWSLLIPAAEMADSPLPATVGLGIGMGAFLFGDRQLEKRKDRDKGSLLALTVTLHNLPEGMAVGVALAAATLTGSKSALMGALVLAGGIALQNLPEGAVISMPLFALGKPKSKAFLAGVASGAVEPAGALLALGMTGVVRPVLPFVLSFAAGAMLWVVVSELIPEMDRESRRIGQSFFGIGFALMMLMDMALG